MATDPAHYVEPLSLIGSPETAMSRLERIVRAMPRARIVSSTEKRIRAEFTSLVFRSASRVGYSDLGVNRRRIEAIRKALSAR
jgi:uncharacterized protein (DUF1499 family)